MSELRSPVDLPDWAFVPTDNRRRKRMSSDNQLQLQPDVEPQPSQT